MTSTTKPWIASIFFILISFEFRTFSTEPHNTPVDLVCKLYKDYAWVGLGIDSKNSPKIFGKGLLAESKEVLSGYFDARLTTLIQAEHHRTTTNPGELGLLEFDMIFASQDPCASDFRIAMKSSNVVLVSFAHPSNQSKFEIEYHISGSGNDCRISDLIYTREGRQSLIQILSGK